MKNIVLPHPLWLAFAVVLMFLLSLASGSQAAEEKETPPDPQLVAKEREAKMAEAEAKLQEALKRIAVAKKDIEETSNSDLSSAERKKAQAQAEQSIAEAEKAAIEASFPTSSAKPMEGKIDLDDKAGYFAEILAYESVGENADNIVKAIKSKLVKLPAVPSKGESDKAKGQKGASSLSGPDQVDTVYLVKQSDFLKGALQLQEIENRLKTFSATFEALLKYPVAPKAGEERNPLALGLAALAVAPAVLGTVADIAAMFRVDRSIKGRVTAVNDEALIAEVARSLGHEGIAVVRPSFNLQPAPSILRKLQATREKADAVGQQLAKTQFTVATASNNILFVQGEITNVQKSIETAATEMAAERKDRKEEIKRLKDLFEKAPANGADERTRLEEEIKAREKELADWTSREEKRGEELDKSRRLLTSSLVPLQNAKAVNEIAITQIETALKVFSEFTGNLTAIPAGATASPLVSLAETCILRDCSAQARILIVGVASQGGEVETRKSMWTSGHVYHRAGSVCSYILLDHKGTMIDSGLVVADRQTKEGKPINVKRPPRSQSIGKQP